MESFRVVTNKFLGQMFTSPLRQNLHDKITREADRIMIIDGINIHVTSSDGVTASGRGVAHTTLVDQLTVFLTSHTRMATIQIYNYF